MPVYSDKRTKHINALYNTCFSVEVDGTTHTKFRRNRSKGQLSIACHGTVIRVYDLSQETAYGLV
jgi:hypothetical protein